MPALTNPQVDWIERMTREKGRSPAGVFGPTDATQTGVTWIVVTWVNNAWLVHPNGEYSRLERKAA